MSNNVNPKQRRHTSNQQNGSIFGALVLIGIGVYLLLNNLGVVTLEANWKALFSVWPVFLIFGGLGILSKQIPPPTGRLLQLVVNVGAFAFFVAVLFFTDQVPFIDQVNTAEIQREQVTVPRDGVDTAEITLDFTSRPVTVNALNDSPHLLDGRVSYTGNLRLDQSISDDEATVSLGVNSTSWWQNVTWSNEDRWEIGLNPSVATELNLDLASGASTLNLAKLNLTGLTIDSGSGASTINLPEGNYDISYDGGSGGGQINLPASGQLELIMDTGSGAVALYLPPNMEAYVIVDGGSGRWNIDQDRFQLVEKDGNDSIWQTADYTEGSENSLYLNLDMGSGSISLQTVE